MKKFVYRLSFSLLFCGTFLSCETGGPEDYKEYFIKYYGGDGDQVAKDFIINTDGTVVMLGTFYETNGDTRLYLVKADAEGNVVWSKKMGSTSEYAQDIEPILAGPDMGNFIILSNVSKNEEDSLAIRLTVVSSDDGDSLKSSYFNFLDSQEGYAITPKADGGYFVGGKTTDPNTSDNVSPDFINIEDLLLIEFEPDLSYQEFNVGRIEQSATGTVVKIFDNGPPYYFAGSYDGENKLETDETPTESNFFFYSFSVVAGVTVPIDYAGSADEEDNEYMTAIINRSAFYVAVGTRVKPSGARSLFAATLNSGFSVTGESVYSSENVEGVSVNVSSEGQYLILGNEITTGGNRNIWFTRVNSLDQLPTSNPITFGATNNDDTASAIGDLPNGDVLILGTMELVNQKKMALIKIKADGSF